MMGGCCAVDALTDSIQGSRDGVMQGTGVIQVLIVLVLYRCALRAAALSVLGADSVQGHRRARRSTLPSVIFSEELTALIEGMLLEVARSAFPAERAVSHSSTVGPAACAQQPVKSQPCCDFATIIRLPGLRVVRAG